MVDATLDAVLAEVEQLEREGAAVPDARAIAGADEDEAAEEAADAETSADALVAAIQRFRRRSPCHRPASPPKTPLRP